MAVLDYQKIYQAASRAYGIPASVLAGDVQIESGGNLNAQSPAGAFGLTQFMPGTAASYGVKRGDPTSEIMGQAHYLHDLGYSKDARRALSSYNAGPGNPGAAGDYAAKVLAAAKQYASLDKGMSPAIASLGNVPMVNAKFGNVSGTQPPNVFDALAGLEQTRQTLRGDTAGASALQSGWNLLSGIVRGQQAQQAAISQVNTVGPQPSAVTQGSGDVNPLHHFSIGRTDMGVDADAAPGTPILAPNDSVVVHIYPNWYRGQPYLLLKLTSGPNAGKYYYVAEQIDNLARPGTTVKRGQPIATYARNGTGIEIGWGTPGSQTQAQATGRTGDPSHGNSPSGVSFRNYLRGLGA